MISFGRLRLGIDLLQLVVTKVGRSPLRLDVLPTTVNPRFGVVASVNRHLDSVSLTQVRGVDRGQPMLVDNRVRPVLGLDGRKHFVEAGVLLGIFFVHRFSTPGDLLF